MHESLEVFEFWPDPTTDYGELPLSVRKKSPYTCNGGKRCFHFFSAVFDQILYILAGNDDIHKRMDELKFFQI